MERLLSPLTTGPVARSRHSSKALGIQGVSTSDGADAVHYDDWIDANQ
jgi:hypothetical protein